MLKYAMKARAHYSLLNLLIAQLFIGDVSLFIGALKPGEALSDMRIVGHSLGSASRDTVAAAQLRDLSCTFVIIPVCFNSAPR